ncbi:hypothetical protein M3P19_15580 [Muricauda sp. 2012CJ35-5]|uniref:DUF4468 domain-containing protein n=1 Tax=Flagellimonas spongiicola TaxID=2942208 RepID=A0ABT0PVL7_9FLAO|nr:hypothetical protein [Allomuricauda spongiicola]MCL6275435.1 hypothetical protein [Allomuricauda spongiicola]
MRNLFVFLLSITLASCNVKSQNSKSSKLLFEDIVVDSIKVELSAKSAMLSTLLDESRIYNFKLSIEKIHSSELSKGNKIHGASTLGNAYIYSDSNKYVINFLEHPTKGIIANFLEQKRGSNFQSYLGAYLEADKLYEKLVEASN